MAGNSISGTITAIATAFPNQVRSNAWWEDHYPELVANAREATLARLWADFEDGQASVYDRAIARYLADPFRGTVERRVMSPGMTGQQLELAAARAALAAGDIDPASVDLILLAALRPDSLVVGDAAFLVRELGVRAPAISFETACSSALVGFSLAGDLVRAGRYRRILVIVCCTYTRDVELGDSFSWFLGDGAAAFVVEPSEHSGILGAHTIPTTETCGAFAYQPTVVDGAATLRLRANREIAGRSIRDNSELYLRRCVDGALSEAGLGLGDVDFLVCNTPTAWFAQFCADALAIEQTRTVDGYPRFANCGPSLWPSNLALALRDRSIAPGDLVLGFSIGSVSTASSVVFRAGEIAVGEVEI
ncbi:MAG TPA: 3-oxoacyl-[acyl-carrier-protein] synthase III C-terminal domain-containing protein [Enhygromyxa sp.]|nr:3-oxoacyl-[acyl-carrier-protein] synthase III C-terminal domain-containing protein [Enhygromyxa sp.]